MKTTTHAPRHFVSFLTRLIGPRHAALLLRIGWLPVSLGALALALVLLWPTTGQSQATPITLPVLRRSVESWLRRQGLIEVAINQQPVTPFSGENGS